MNITLDNIKPVIIRCKCGTDNSYYTLPLDNDYKCRWCGGNEIVTNATLRDFFLGDVSNKSISSRRLMNWMMITAGVAIIGIGFAWYFNKRIRKRA